MNNEEKDFLIHLSYIYSLTDKVKDRSVDDKFLLSEVVFAKGYIDSIINKLDDKVKCKYNLVYISDLFGIVISDLNTNDLRKSKYKKIKEKLKSMDTIFAIAGLFCTVVIIYLLGFLTCIYL